MAVSLPKIPAILRPYVGKIVGSAVTIGAAALGTQVPFIAPFLTPDAVAAVTTIVTTWLLATSVNTATNAYINPTNSASSKLADKVPAVVAPKEVISDPTVVITATGPEIVGENKGEI